METTSRPTNVSLDRPKLEISDPMGFAKVTAKKTVRGAKKRIGDEDVFCTSGLLFFITMARGGAEAFLLHYGIKKGNTDSTATKRCHSSTLFIKVGRKHNTQTKPSVIAIPSHTTKYSPAA